MYQYLKSALGRMRDDDGGVTVEFVVLFPALLALTGVAMDVGFTYFKMTQVQAAVQDVTRARSIGAIASNADAEALLESRLALGFTDEADVTVRQIGPVLSTKVRVPLHDMQLVGFFANIIGDPVIELGDQQFREDFDVAVVDPAEDPGGVMVDGILEDAVSSVTGTVGGL